MTKTTLNNNYAAPTIEIIAICVEHGFQLSGGAYPGGEVETNPLSMRGCDDSFFSNE
ncbi:MAG: hypothetical protein RRZ83_00170 [Alistipes sp.]